MSFALVRHAGYKISTGSLTAQAIESARDLATKLKELGGTWREIRVSPSRRTKEMGTILAEELHLSLEIDERLDTDGNFVEFLPPKEQHGCIFVSHLPIITQVLRSWSRYFKQSEPPLTEVANGYIVDAEKKIIKPIR